MGRTHHTRDEGSGTTIFARVKKKMTSIKDGVFESSAVAVIMKNRRFKPGIFKAQVVVGLIKGKCTSRRLWFFM